MKDWLSGCEKRHSDQHCDQAPDQSLRESTKLRLIDVNEMCLVEANAPLRYLTLSYVWGGQQPVVLAADTIKWLFTPGSMSNSDIPRTIQDAISICIKLGEQYLWVDAICIQQDDIEDTRYQIGNMGMIYAASVLTIVNASTAEKVTADSPLPGVNPGTRNIRQSVYEVGSKTILLSSRRPFANILSSCQWRLRGWTLREELLSRRLLYLSEEQAFF